MCRCVSVEGPEGMHRKAATTLAALNERLRVRAGQENG